MQPEDIDVEQSILAQRKDPDHYPELTYLGKEFRKIRLYRELSFGRYTPPRLPQKSDLPNDFLSEDGKNLGLVLNRLAKDFKVKQEILKALHDLYDGVSERCQLIVTTHSDTLIDALTETPESVVVCEKINGQTTLKRLDKSKLAHWLEKYRLGELWSTGELGGNRW